MHQDEEDRGRVDKKIPPELMKVEMHQPCNHNRQEQPRSAHAERRRHEKEERCRGLDPAEKRQVRIPALARRQRGKQRSSAAH